MTHFFDLPKLIRVKIYRLHLVHDEPVSNNEHNLIASHRSGGRRYHGYLDTYTQKKTPPLLAVSKQADREAAPIYYGENHFEFDPVRVASPFAMNTYPRHLRLIRKVTCEWGEDMAREGFLAISRMKSLQELYIRVNEGSMIRNVLSSRHLTQRYYIPDDELTSQQQLCLLRHPGMSGLLAISNIPLVEFTRLKPPTYSSDPSGPLPDGFLQTQVLPRLKGIWSHPIRRARPNEDCFRFLSLPPEIRNRIYNLLLRFDGKIHPSAGQPSSTKKHVPKEVSASTIPDSALSLLAVNKQVNSEAFGIFYYFNAFEFYYPTQLHAFLLSIGEGRQKYLRDITLHYYNYKVGGIDIAELTFPVLKQLTGLRRLHIVLDMNVHKLIRSNFYFMNGSGWNIDKANPLRLPGMKSLFSLRGITDIKLRCGELDKELEEAKKDKEYPKFSEKSKKACVLKLVGAFEHFNKALANAQKGLVNKKMLEDPEWHIKDDFPIIDETATATTQDEAQAEAKMVAL